MTRIRQVYRSRAEQHGPRLPTAFDALVECQKRHELLRLLQAAGVRELRGLKILDVGCGIGTRLRHLVELGADPDIMCGVDALEDRIELGRQRSPNLDLRVADGKALPFPDDSMDLVLLETVLSSIPDASIRQSLADEVRRVARAGATIIVFDFRISKPSNPDTVGIRMKHIRTTFPHAQIRRRTLLMPPRVGQALYRLHPAVYTVLERLAGPFRTHAYYALRIATTTQGGTND